MVNSHTDRQVEPAKAQVKIGLRTGLFNRTTKTTPRNPPLHLKPKQYTPILVIAVTVLISLSACKGQNRPDPAVRPTTRTETDSTHVITSVTAPQAVPLLSLEYLSGRFDPAKHPDFIAIPLQYADEAGRYLHRQTYDAFVVMHAAALRDGVVLKIVSATRNFDAQKRIWERKWRGETKLSDGTDASTIVDHAKRASRILEYSSMPGTSRHHWGTDIDINALNDEYFQAGTGKKVYAWLTANAHKYGFCQPYTPKGAERPYGYNEEKWHWTYTPLSAKLTGLAREQLRNTGISGFEGAGTASALRIVERYVLGINNNCNTSQ